MALVYVIEDDQELCDLVTESLREAGHEAHGFATAVMGIEAYERTPADVVVVDMIIRVGGRITKPGGLVAIWRIKKTAQEKDDKVLVIAISGATSHPGMGDILATADQFGADAVLDKPFEPDDLLFAIHRGLEGTLEVDRLGAPKK